MTFHISERVALESAKVSGDTYRVRLISEGQGSSGYYAGEMLERDTAAALPKGTLFYFDHTSLADEEQRGGTRSIRDVAGKMVSDPEYVEGEKAPYAQVKFTREALPLVEDVGDAIGVSIEVYAGKRSEDDENVIESLSYHPLNSVALVPVPGRDGRIVDRVAESLRKSAEGIKNDDEGTDMPISEEDVKAIAEASATLVLERMAEKIEASENEKPETNIAEMVEAIAAAGLPKAMRAQVIESVEAGADVSEAIAKQTELLTEIQESVSKTDVEDGEVLGEGAAVSNEDYFSENMKKMGR